jgi:hypothetical protein
MTIGSYTRIAALAGAAAALIAGAVALWLSTGPSSQAASAPQVQGTTVSVPGKTISWTANGFCEVVRNTVVGGLTYPGPNVTADFGVAPPGGGTLGTGDFTGCVNSNATWNVDAVATPLTSPTDADADGFPDSIPAANLQLKAQGLTNVGGVAGSDPSPAPITPGCAGAAACSLGVSRPIVVGAAPSPQSSGFLYSYVLDVPASAPSGTYTGSVTFTASN